MSILKKTIVISEKKMMKIIEENKRDIIEANEGSNNINFKDIKYHKLVEFLLWLVMKNLGHYPILHGANSFLLVNQGFEEIFLFDSNNSIDNDVVDIKISIFEVKSYEPKKCHFNPNMHINDYDFKPTYRKLNEALNDLGVNHKLNLRISNAHTVEKFLFCKSNPPILETSLKDELKKFWKKDKFIMQNLYSDLKKLHSECLVPNIYICTISFKKENLFEKIKENKALHSIIESVNPIVIYLENPNYYNIFNFLGFHYDKK